MSTGSRVTSGDGAAMVGAGSGAAVAGRGAAATGAGSTGGASCAVRVTGGGTCAGSIAGVARAFEGAEVLATGAGALTGVATAAAGASTGAAVTGGVADVEEVPLRGTTGALFAVVAAFAATRVASRADPAVGAAVWVAARTFDGGTLAAGAFTSAGGVTDAVATLDDGTGVVAATAGVVADAAGTGISIREVFDASTIGALGVDTAEAAGAGEPELDARLTTNPTITTAAAAPSASNTGRRFF